MAEPAQSNDSLQTAPDPFEQHMNMPDPEEIVLEMPEATAEDIEAGEAVTELNLETQEAVNYVMGEQYDAHIQAFEEQQALQEIATKRGLSEKDVKDIMKAIKERDRVANRGEKLKSSSLTKALAYTLSSLNFTRMGNLQSMAEHDPEGYNELITEMIMEQSGNLLWKLASAKNPFEWGKRSIQMFARWCPGTNPTDYMSDKKTIIYANMMVATGVLPAPEHVAKAAEQNVAAILSDTKTLTTLSTSVLAPILTVLPVPGARVAAGSIAATGAAVGGATLAFEQFLGKDMIKGMAAERARRNKMREEGVKEIPHTVETDPQKFEVDLEAVYKEHEAANNNKHFKAAA